MSKPLEKMCQLFITRYKQCYGQQLHVKNWNYTYICWTGQVYGYVSVLI